MNPAVKEKWLTALRSGDYHQGLGRLRTADDSFCCLGVLCDIAVKEGIIPPPIPIFSSGVPDPEYIYVEQTMTLPQRVIDWADLYDSNPAIPPKYLVGVEDTLAGLNDSGFRFDQIADLIEVAF